MLVCERKKYLDIEKSRGIGGQDRSSGDYQASCATAMERESEYEQDREPERDLDVA